ncbi:WAT1-related protein At5g40240-like isoform X3 [Vigna unguiculata]|uniref:WAT1-related protein At5g40240-like isoform X3 n=1 Tax=Vigna unguiculata TaxID=3917 RepID=UPI0010166227|nr:WAT1-related protein At5g40240-like isoform X3 [Vigna unguiculata]
MARLGNGSAKLLPFVGMMVAMLTQSGSMVVIKFAMIDDINKYVMVVYSFALSTILLLPFAFFLHRSAATTMGYVGIELSSPTLGSDLLSLVPAFTFILALIFRMEEVHWRNSSSQAKVLGTITSIAGAFVVVLYKGPIIFKTRSSNFSNQILQFSQQLNWILGGIFFIAYSLFNSMWYIYQAYVAKKYPDVTVTVFFQLLFSTVQCGVFALIAVRDPTEWKLNFDIGLVGVLYQAIVATMISYLLFQWCVLKAGPLFCSMFSPVAMIFTVFMGAIFLGDDLSLGSLIGAVIIVVGFYGVLWGKSKEENEIAEGVEDFDSSFHDVPLLQDRNRLKLRRFYHPYIWESFGY